MSTARIKHILTPSTNHKERFISDYKELKDIVDHLKKVGYRIVLTQGVYDLIHEGHALYLEAARSHGDVLVVGVDSDELTRQRKGPERPIVPQGERVKMLVHLRHVDIVTLRNVGEGIGDLIKLVKPDVLVVSKSTGDFDNKQQQAYKKYCGKIITLPPQATTSTSARIRLLAIEGAEKLAREITKLTQDFLAKIRKG
ncbi:adenylyltransferase/cytidyltransferase family protein [Patescibacteria group bacterium]|nr:adenylyltransferase/cytidyltransferase family protein [Patescibacteria group bacterium]